MSAVSPHTDSAGFPLLPDLVQCSYSQGYCKVNKIENTLVAVNVNKFQNSSFGNANFQICGTQANIHVGFFFFFFV